MRKSAAFPSCCRCSTALPSRRRSCAPPSGTTNPTRKPLVIQISSIAPRLAKGEIKSEKLTEDCLSKIASLNATLNAFITVTADEALQQARQADGEIAAGRYFGPLHGI